MKPATFKLNRHIFELLQEGKLQRFTTLDLRDAYAQKIASSDIGLGELWKYIYEQVRRLKHVGWIRQDEVRRKRGQVFHVLGKPELLSVELVDCNFMSCSPPQGQGPTAGILKPVEAPSQRLETLAKEIRLDLLTSMGEAERYKQLLNEMPQLKVWVEDNYVEARDRSSRLLGHLKAVEKTLKSLAA
ncbi:hypothetical protein KVQ82_01685 [Pseudomonas sp. AO-1]|uniref:hypothetical protein n=1 Tax=Pseudomonas sp. AO-1 TaxID=2855434 RepID=UPI001C7947E9|nr:hypothetical protein [Pseudomonas sp. AO-1]QXZ14665.1 hypothetical protein KVQ82_01685 [Pseudomonas sp. AO-1]